MSPIRIANVLLTLVLLIGSLSCTNAIAQESPADAKEIKDLVTRAGQAYDKGQFGDSAECFSKAIELGSQEPTVGYNGACSAALAGQTDLAFQLLTKAVNLGWTDGKHLQSDSDLDSLHSDPRWKPIVADVRKKSKSIDTRWNSEALSTPFVENISDAEKAAGLSKVWSEVKFNFVNFDGVPELDWDALYMEYMPKVLSTESTLEYYQLLEEMVAHLKDGHTNVYLPGLLRGQFRARPGMRTQLVEDRVIVRLVYDPKLKEQGISVGQELLEIDDTPVREFAEANIRPLMAASTPQDSDTRTYDYFLLQGDMAKPIKMRLVDADGAELTTEVKRLTSMQKMVLARRDPAFEFEMLEGKIAYIKLNTFGTNSAAAEFEKQFDEISKSDAIILDVRKNGGGNSSVGWKILGYLTDKPFQTTRWHTLQYRPTFRAWNRNPLSNHGSDGGTFATAKEHYYQNPVVMLTGPGTFSAAEDMVAAFDMLDRGKIIGQPTGGSTGQPLIFNLPGGGKARVCTKHDSYADGTEFVGRGIQPSVLIAPTISDIRHNKDTVLNAAVDLLKSN